MFKQKLLNVIAAHPKLVTLGIGLALTLAIGTAITGMFEVQQAHAVGIANQVGSVPTAFAAQICRHC
jgi:hypothetical protein